MVEIGPGFLKMLPKAPSVRRDPRIGKVIGIAAPAGWHMRSLAPIMRRIVPRRVARLSPGIPAMDQRETQASYAAVTAGAQQRLRAPAVARRWTIEQADNARRQFVASDRVWLRPPARPRSFGSEQFLPLRRSGSRSGAPPLNARMTGAQAISLPAVKQTARIRDAVSGVSGSMPAVAPAFHSGWRSGIPDETGGYERPYTGDSKPDRDPWRFAEVVGEPDPENGMPARRLTAMPPNAVQPVDGPDGIAKGKAMMLHIDGHALGQWAVEHLTRTLARPPTGITGIDPRASPPRTRVSPF